MWLVIEEEIALMPKETVSLVVCLLLDLGTSLGMVEYGVVPISFFFSQKL